MSRYLQLWRIPGAPMLLIGGMVARLGHGVTVVAWLVLIRAVTGSYADAGLVAGVISLATAFAAPVAGRLVDRYAVRRVLPICALGYSATQIGLLVAVSTEQSLAVLVVLATITGALFPPMSPAIRSGWTNLTAPGSGHEASRTSAMAAESTVFELVFVTGPLVLSAFVLTVNWFGVGDPSRDGAAWAIATASLTTAIGTAVVAGGTALGALKGTDANRATGGIGPLRVSRFPMMLVITAATAFSFGVSPVAITAFAETSSADSGSALTGILIAVWSLGSAAGGLIYGALPMTGDVGIPVLARRGAILLTALTAGYALWNAAGGSVVFAVVLLLTGAVIAPATTVLAEMVAVAVPAGMLTEAYTWFTCVNMSTAALGAAVAGRLVDSAGGVHTAFWVCAVAAAAGAIGALLLGVRTPREHVVVNAEVR